MTEIRELPFKNKKARLIALDIFRGLTNAIAAYLVAEVLDDLLIVRWTGRENGKSIQEWAMGKLLTTGISPELLSFVWALAFWALCFIPIYILYRKKIFLKI